uniref:Uncharacterized protein n=1 Tax=Oryza nivara TaxID=4536 RepID=A0A0E0FFM0_ORYNI
MQIVHNLLVSYDNYPSTGQQLRITRCGGGGGCSWGYVVWKAVDGVAAIASENQEFRIATGSTSRQLLIVRSAVEQLCTCTALLPPTGKKGAGNRWAPRWQCLQ